MAATNQQQEQTGGSGVMGQWCRVLRIAAVMVLFTLGGSVALAQADRVPFIMMDGKRVHPTSVLVKYGPRVTAANVGATLQAANLRVVKELSVPSRWALLDSLPQAPQTPPGEEARALRDRIDQLRQSGQFESVEPDYVRQLNLLPPDTFFQDGTLWGLRNTGQSGGVAGADINVTNAWDITVGNTNVIIAVLDSGIRYDHVDLAGQMWRNPGEIAGDGIDNDGDGFIDNVFGINALTGSGDPNDDNGHGTHVAGTIGAAPNNGQSHVGVVWNSRLMAVKVADRFGFLTSSAIIAGVDFAISKGAKVINASFGGYFFSQAEFDAYLRARNAGILVVAAAGNDGINTDIQPHYPSSYQLDNIIAVAALDRSDRLASFSNYGRTSVHLGAPGVEITSTYNTSSTSYQQLQGTSMAAPHVAGVAGLVFALTNTITVSEVRNRILFTTTPVAALATNTIQNGRVNAHRALTTVQDNLLEVLVSPASGSTLLAGSTVTFTVEVSDLLPVNNATVVGTIPGLFTNQVFLNNGVNPDSVASDNRHSLSVTLLAVATNSLPLTLSITAPGKTNYSNTVTYRTATVPPNDNFVPTAKVPDGGGTVVGDNTFATLQTGEPAHAGVTGAVRSVWWNWAPVRSSSVLVDTAGSTFDTVVAVYTNSLLNTTLTNLSLVVGTNDAGGILQGFVKFDAVAGTTYRIAVASASTNTSGQIRLRVLFDADPDTQAPAITITNLVSGAQSVTNPPSGLIVTNAQLVLSGTAIDPGTNAIGVRQVQVQLNNGLAVSATGTNDWTVPLFLSPGANVISISASDFSGNVSLPVTFQVNYRVFDPFNDVLANALELTGTIGSMNANTANATSEPGEPHHVGKQGGKSVWYFFTPTTDGLLSLTTSNSTYDTLLAVYTGTRVDRLTPVGANDDAPVPDVVHSDLYQAVRAGVRYYVAVDGLAGASGQLVLTYGFTALPIYQLTVSATVGGRVSPTSGTFVSNSVVDITAVASNGFSFVTWQGDERVLDNPLRLTVTRPTALTAVFAPRLLAENFESGAFRPNIGWLTNNPAGVQPWYVEATNSQSGAPAQGGAFHARSGATAHGQTNFLRLVALTRAGSASFAYRVNSEANGPTSGDFLEFYLNGSLRVRTNGDSGWLTHSFTVPAATNVLEWRYVKDSSFSSGEDAGFVDNLDLPIVEPVDSSVVIRFGTNSVRVVNGGLQFRIEGQTNQVYRVQASSDLANWVNISTNYAPYGLIQFSEPQTFTNASRYYRVVAP